MRTVLACTLTALLCTGATATAASLITGEQIKNGTVTGADIRNGSLKPADLAASTRGKPGATGPQGIPGTQGPQGAPGPASIAIGRFSEVATVNPGTTAQVVATCPHGQVVTMTHRFVGAQSAVVTGVSLHDTSGTLSVQNDGADPVQAIGTVTCVDTQPF